MSVAGSKGKEQGDTQGLAVFPSLTTCIGGARSLVETLACERKAALYGDCSRACSYCLPLTSTARSLYA